MSASDRNALRQRQSKLSPLKRALLARYKGGEWSADPAAGRIPPRGAGGPVPLSFAQERMWFLDQLEPGGAVYNLPALVRLRGRLDVAALGGAFDRLVGRHEILRTRFVMGDEGPVQEILPGVEVGLPVIDLSRCPHREQEAHRCLLRAARRGFDLTRPPLFRALLLRLGEREHLLLLTVHHIVSDGWSDGILVRELGSFYQALRGGAAAPLPPLPIQYADYALWQRQGLGDEVLAGQLAYWQRQLAGAPSLLELPTDRPRPAVKGLRGAHLPVRVGARMAAQLRQLGREHGTTLFTLLLGAFQLLLQRYTDQSDLCLGTPVANRERSEIEPLIGFFVNTVVLRVSLGGNPSFLTLLQRIRRTTLDAHAHQDLPFEALVGELAPERDLSYSPLIQVMFVYQNTPFETLTLPGLTIDLLPFHDQTSKFDLMLVLSERMQDLGGYLEYDVALFDRTTMERLVGHWHTLLEGIAAAPERRLAELPLLRPPERHQLLWEWNDSQSPWSLDACLHQRFEQQAARSPARPALVLDDERLSYGELNRRANRLAHRLRALGVGTPALRAEVAVGICLERSPAMVTAILAVLKAGGFYVPLDPALPLQRIRFMVEDSRIAIVLSRQGLAPKLCDVPARVLAIDADAAGAEENPPAATAVGSLAYVLYTSGSTGLPKGVACTHAGVLNLLADFTSRAPLGPGDGCSWWTSPTFDVSVYELFSALLAGGTLHVVPERIRGDGQRFAAWLRAERIASAYVTPSMLPDLVSADGDESTFDRPSIPPYEKGGRPHPSQPPLGLKRLLVGVEPIPEPLLVAIREQVPGLRIINGYGPTEATVCVTLYDVRGPGREGRTPIGRPVANDRIYLLDHHLRPVPQGVEGELCIGGAGLARGYHRRPAQTAERYVPDPLGAAGGRLYRTGDLVRHLADGNLLFGGRRDFQVKIRGFRIELGEIEAALLRHPAVREAVVLARDEEGEIRLVAYLVARPEPAPAELRDFLGRILTSYMVPSTFVFLDELPLTPAGKVDRKALPAPPQDGPAPRAAPPRTPEEEILAEVWSEVLNCRPVGIDDDFFALGGHSLMATQVVSRVREIFQVDLAVRQLFEEPTVAGLAQVIHAARPREPLPPLRPVSDRDPLPLSFAQQRLWMLDQLQPGDAAYNVPTAVRLRGRPRVTALAATLSELVRRHQALRTHFALAGGRPVQVIGPPPRVPLPEVDLRRLAAAGREREADRVALAEARRSFVLQEGPLFRCTLLRLGAEEAVLVVNAHHIVFDGWSAGVLIRELAVLYQACCRRSGTEVVSPLPEPTLRYADFAHWQRQWLRGPVLERELDYWRRRLAGLEPLILPTDRPRPPVWDSRGDARRFLIDAELTAGLHGRSREQGATLLMTLLAAFNLLLGRYASVDDLGVGLPVADRGHREIEGLVGYFVNTLVLRVDLGGGTADRDPSFRQLVAQVRRAALDAYAHQDVPFEALVDALAPDRDMSRTPLFQVMFVLQNFPRPRLQAHGLTVEQLELHNGTAKFDLTLILTETEAGIEGLLEYATALFDGATIRRLVGHYRNLLAGVAADDARRLSELPLVAAGERHQLVVEWNHPRAEYDRRCCLHQPFEVRAARDPEAVAVVGAGRSLSYGELNARANRLARRLIALGVGPETLVGVCIERSPEMIVALVGVLKAGGAYVPVDPEYPRDRIAFILRDVRAPVVVTRSAIAAGLDAPEAVAVCLDQEDDADRSAGNPPLGTGPDHTAYVIFTSGSTGRPKGVVLQHRPVINLIEWVNHTFGVGPADRVLLVASMCFDLSVYDLFGLLAAGGSIHVATDAEMRDPERLVEILDSGAITFWDSAPAALSQLVPLLPAPGRGSRRLRLAFLSGDWIPLSLQPALVRTFPNLRVIALGGATEAAIWSNFHPITEVRPEWVSIPYGVAIQNARYYVLDGRLRPCPLGVAGDLYIGGECLSLGYYGRARLTAERYVPDPFGYRPGAVLYTTGDRACWRAAGHLEFLGRIDHQVKIRGFRIELGEIATALGDHPGVRECAVVAGQREPGAARSEGSQYLAAYVVPEEPRPTVDELRQALSQSLPDYMVPTFFVFLEALPLSPSGKVDRRALPAPERAAEAEEESFTAPRTEAEKTLAAIWAQVLGRDRVGSGDNFFNLGGDSILSIQVVSRARAAGWELSLRDLFAHPDLAALAAAARRTGARPEADGPVSGPLPLTPIQHWFFEPSRPAPHHFNQALMLEESEPLAPHRLAAALAVLIEHHDALRLRFDRRADGWRQVNAPPGGPVPFAEVDLAAVSRPALGAAVAAVQASLDLTRGPLVRLVRFDLGAGEPARLLWVIHHLAVDGVSWHILLEDLTAVYRRLEAGEAVSLPPRTTSYKGWAERLTEHAGTAAAELGFWRCQAIDERLPRDHPGGRNTVASARTVTVTLPAEETSALLRQVHSAYRTRIQDLLLAAVVQAFARWTGQPTLVVDVESHGREELFEELDLSRTVGWFTTIHPLLLEWIEEPGALIKAVKERLRAVPGGGLGWGLLRYLDPETAAPLGEQPAPEVVFNYLGQLDVAIPERSPLRPAAETAGPLLDGAGERRHLVEINGGIAGGRLRLTWSYGENLHRRATIEALAAGFRDALAGLIDHCRSPAAGGFTPSDFPEAGLDQAEIDRLLAALGAPEAGLPEAFYPLSPAQQGMLFFALLQEGPSALFTNQMHCVLRGELDVARFREAWRQVVDRHAALRTLMVWEGRERPLQVVFHRVELPWIEEDWRHLPPAEHGQRLRRALEEDRNRGFDLSRAPLMRLTLVRTADDRYHFVWTFHQLILDGWSVQHVLGEVFAVGRALAAGQQPALPPPPPYRDYIVWLERQDPQAAEDFWRQRLAGFEEPTLTGVERRGGEPAAAHRSVELSAELGQRLEALARRRRLTLNTVLQGAWALLLSRYSGRREVFFGAVVAGRPPELEGYERMVGLFINAVPSRVRVEPEATLDAWLAALQNEQAELRQFEHCPVEHVQRWLGVPWNQPLFQTLFIFENYPFDANLATAAQGGGEVVVEKFDVEEAPNYPLNLFVMQSDPLGVRLVYDAARYDAAAIDRMLAHLVRLLDEIAADPARRLGELSLLAPGERERLLSVLAVTPDAAVTGAGEEPVHQQFAEQAARTPEEPAVIGSGEKMSYGELERRANGLAHRLAALGVAAETVVGLCVERSCEMLVGMLGILKAGGTYLPLDPDAPRERLAFMLADAGVSVLVRGAGVPAELAAGRPLVTIAESAGAESGPDRRVRPEQGAYVVYTSGSTGRPKGVVVSHRSLGRYAAGAAEVYGIEPRDRVLQFAALTFDASAEEIYPTLLRGAALVLRDRQLAAPAELLARCREQGITVLNLPTAYWHTLIRWIPPRSPLGTRGDATAHPLMAAAGRAWPESVRLVIIGGEEALAEPLRRWQQEVGDGIALVNTYGPTEATIVATRWPATAAEQTAVPIGRPVDGTRAYVLDRRLRPQAAGVPGELHLGGDGVARGYLGRPALTATRFVSDPFGPPGARLYATGDRVRWRDDRQLEFLGRLDRQVKVRGFRIECGEIEALLAEHPRVRAAAVVATSAAEGTSPDRLVAFVTGEETAADELHGFLRRRLPEYMVPALFLRLPELPLTPAGKVDRGALGRRARTPAAEEGAADQVAPRNEFEQVLAEIFAQLLGRERVGVYDDFFALGGHSLLAAHLATSVREAFEVDLPLREIFENPTVSYLALVIEDLILAQLEDIGEEAAEGMPELPAHVIELRAGRPGRMPLFCAPPAGGDVICYRQLAGALDPGQPVYGLRTRGLAAGETPWQEMEEMAAGYAEYVRAVWPGGPYALLGWSFGGVVAYELARRLEHDGQRVALLANVEGVPHDPTRESRNPTDAELLAEVLGNLGAFTVGEIAELEREEQLAEVVARLRRRTVLPPEFGVDELGRYLDVCRVNVAIREAWVPAPYPGSMVLFRTAGLWPGADDALGWRDVVRGGVEIRRVPGEHHTMIYEPHVEVLAGHLQRLLDACQTPA